MLYKRREQKKKKHWVHPLPQNSARIGTLINLIKRLQNDDAKYFIYYRMSKASYIIMNFYPAWALFFNDKQHLSEMPLTPDEQLTTGRL